MLECEQCNKKFSRSDALKRHTDSHELGSIVCPTCQKRFHRKDAYGKHQKRYHAPENGESALQEPAHKLWRPWEENSAPSLIPVDPNLDDSLSPSDESSQYDDQVLKLIENNAEFISTKRIKSKRIQDRYNFQTESPSRLVLASHLYEIFEDQTTSFKINVSFGFILRHVQTQQLTFYYASNNNKLFDKPITVTSRNDIDDVLSKIDQEDLLEYCRQQRPNSSYIVETITNILFYIDKLKRFVIGCPTDLPYFVRNNEAVVSLNKNYHGLVYRDKLCLFRCVALSRSVNRHRIDRTANALFSQWVRYTGCGHDAFEGVAFDQLLQFENCFMVKVNVFELYEHTAAGATGTGSTIAARPLRRSIKDSQYHEVNVNLYQNHFSYIKNISLYSRRWRCKKCDKLFAHQSRCLRHQATCDDNIKVLFKGGGFGSNRTIFDELKGRGIRITADDEFYPYRIAYDFEAYVKPIVDQVSPKGATKQLQPASVSVCSNVPGYMEPKCFVDTNGDPKDLMVRFFSYLTAISDAAFEKVSRKFQHVVEQIDEQLQRRDNLKSIGSAWSTQQQEECERLDSFDPLKLKLTAWMRQIVVLGFNSGKFDINLIRSHLFPYLIDQKVNVRLIIKKVTTYQCIALDNFLFLDMRNYLSPAVSYEKWIKSLQICQQKGFFPYEWMQAPTDLDTPFLVDKTQFWSTLKQSSISDDDYAYLQDVWDSRGFQTMRDLLEWYNNLDVGPFISAAEMFFQHWKDLGIDPFKSGSISLPGLALTHLMNTIPKHVVLPLIPKKHEDIYFCIKSNIVGGLSAVFHRYHEKNLTTLPNGMKTDVVVSRDANGLYLYCLGQETGTGIIQIWRSNDTCFDVNLTRPDMSLTEINSWKMEKELNMSARFSRQSMYPLCQKELEWLEWFARSTGCSVQHRFNGGQHIIRKSKRQHYPVDGFIAETNTVLQFHGCFWHGHNCRKNANPNHEKRLQTEEISANLKKLGYVVIEMWECEWEQMKRTNAQIRAFIIRNVSMNGPKGPLSSDEIIEHVTNGTLYGLIECDIEVPRFMPELDLYFKEFPPIFKNCEVSIDDIGEFMKEYAKKFDLMRKPRRCLVNSYFGKRILLTTALLQWYIEKGLVVTRVHQFLQMKPKRCFQHLVDEVTFHRRAADSDPTLAPIGSTWKDTGNHYYGKTATDKFKHKHVELSDDVTAWRLVNDKRYCCMEEVGESAFEITMDKKVIKIDLPITVAFFVYGGAKLRMLEFVYDFLKKYLKAGSYQIVCMDTDSIIAAYADKDIDNLVIPQMLPEYHQTAKQQFLVTDDHSLRTPGLFKEELVADGIIALCSKTYFAWGADHQKAVSKGLSKVTNKLTKRDYMNVLRTGIRGSGMNHGFKTFGQSIFQYQQRRSALSYLYIKRKVMEDGISTEPLNL